MNSRHICSVLWIAVALTTAFAQEMTPVNVGAIQEFAKPESALRELVNAKKGGATNNFCIVGYKDEAGTVTAWVHWVERNALIFWEPPEPLAQSRRYLDLRRDVVASDDQLKGSTYLVTKPWVKRLLADCKAVGSPYVIRRTQPRSRKE
jgi:hypothetical protein